MNNLRISYLNISPYSRHSPSVQLKTDLKKQSTSVERPKSHKVSYSGATTRGQTPVNNPDSVDRKYSPFAERKTDQKVDIITSLYQLAKSKQKDRPSTSKSSKTKDVTSKKSLKSSGRPSDRLTEKLAIYQYLQSKGSKKSDESKMSHPSMHQTPSHNGSRSQLHEEKDYSHERKMLEASILQQRQLIEALEEMHRSKAKSTTNVQNQNNLALILRSAQRPSQSNSGKAIQLNTPSLNMLSSSKGQDEHKRILEPRKSDQITRDNIKLSIDPNEKQTQKEKVIIQPAEAEFMTKKHRRGLSMGQNPLSNEQFAYEQERIRYVEQERQKKIEQERIRQLELQQLQQQQLQLQQQQLQQQQQQQYRDPQQEEDEFYEEFFHMDKMTFNFEKLMVAKKLSQSQLDTPGTSPARTKQGTSHTRTRSIEEHNSALPPKSSSRWTAKRSSMGDDRYFGGARENLNVVEQISHLDRTYNEKENNRRYYRI